MTRRRLAVGRPLILAGAMATCMLPAMPARALDQEAFAASFATAMRDAMLAMAQRMAKGPECLVSRFAAPQHDPLLVRRARPGHSTPSDEPEYVPLGHSSLAELNTPTGSQCQSAQ